MVHECQVNEGETHDDGCQQEICPYCGKRLCNCICSLNVRDGRDTCISCSKELKDCKCTFIVLFDDMDPSAITMYFLSKGIDHYTTSSFDDDIWMASLEKKGRVPHVYLPNLCVKCGMEDPELFMVPDEEWKAVVPIHLQKSILCQQCYEHVRNIMHHENGVNVSEYVLFAGNHDRIINRNVPTS